jgi:sialic acid synthase SpsE
MTRVPFVIAEAGVNHNGDLQRALAMVDAAAESGADCVKFQAFDPDKLIAKGTRSAAYQARNTGSADQLEMIRSLALSLDDFARLAERCRQRGIEFLATAFDVELVEDLVRLGMRRIKVASGELTNHPALERFAGLAMPVLLSTGMADDSEISAAVDVLRANGARDITLLQCTSIYPAPAALANLRAMVGMGARNAVPFGYSDHTLGEHTAVAAVAMGACTIEKHFTLDCALPGPDHKASMEPPALAGFIVRLRETAAALGTADKRPGAEERETAALVRRSWHAARDLPAGTQIVARDIVLKRPAAGLAPAVRIVGRRLRTAVAADTPITAAALDEG